MQRNTFQKRQTMVLYTVWSVFFVSCGKKDGTIQNRFGNWDIEGESMKKISKVNMKMLAALMVCLFFSVIMVLRLQNSWGAELEELIFSKLVGEEEELHLQSEVHVVTIPSVQDTSLTTLEESKMLSEQIRELRYLLEKTFISAQGVYLLDSELFTLPANERRLLPVFRKSDNVFWHFNNRNISYYYEEDKCGQVKYLDNYYGKESCFEVFGKGKYDRNYLPYYMMTMNGGSVEYNELGQKYEITDASGKKSTLYAMEDSSVRIHTTSKYNVSYSVLDDVYEEAVRNNHPEQYKDSIIFIQSKNQLSDYVEGGSATRDLADYYIDVLGTIQNEKSIPFLNIRVRIFLVILGVTALGLAVIFLRSWISGIIYLCEMLVMFFANLLFLQHETLYLPLFDFWMTVTIMFAILLCLKPFLHRADEKNLPIDAVIRFANTIVSIEHSVSYSEYLMKNRNEIEEDISAALLLPVIDKESFLLKELASENNGNKRFVETEFWGNNENMGTTSIMQVRSNLFSGQKYLAFVPLPVFDVESELTTYTVIGLKKKLKPQNASYISMMLFSMYIYFKAQHERGEHQRMYFSMLSLIISVIDAKDPVTAGHSQRVASISKDIGIWLDLSKNEQFDLEFTALLHDIGKIGVSDYVLNKQSVYTKNDFEQMKYHTIRGAEMLSEVGISEEIIDGVRHHHERLDGKGYPDGLKGDELHLFAKIIKIADVFDALTSKRQYKDAWETDRALSIIYKGRGTEFDTEIANVFIKHMASPGWIPPVDEKSAQKKKDPNTDKAVLIVQDFYDKYKQYLSIDYPIPSNMALEVDFLRKNGFMQYDWGETFDNAVFLEEKPMILSYEKNSKSLIFGQNSKGNGVNRIYYYFFKGFVNMGVYLMEPSGTRAILEKLEDAYGEPVIIDEQMMVYEMMKMRIVFYHTMDDKHFLFYISDYMCSNYIFKERSQNQEPAEEKNV